MFQVVFQTTNQIFSFFSEEGLHSHLAFGQPIVVPADEVHGVHGTENRWNMAVLHVSCIKTGVINVVEQCELYILYNNMYIYIYT